MSLLLQEALLVGDAGRWHTPGVPEGAVGQLFPGQLVISQVEQLSIQG